MPIFEPSLRPNLGPFYTTVIPQTRAPTTGPGCCPVVSHARPNKPGPWPARPVRAPKAPPARLDRLSTPHLRHQHGFHPHARAQISLASPAPHVLHGHPSDLTAKPRPRAPSQHRPTAPGRTLAPATAPGQRTRQLLHAAHPHFLLPWTRPSHFSSGIIHRCPSPSRRTNPTT